MDKKLDRKGVKNEIKGVAKVIEGRSKKVVGVITGNKVTQSKGTAKELEGSVQKAIGKAQREIADES